MIAVASLWILMILSVFSITVGSEVRSELTANRHHLMKLKSYHLAQSGIALATRVVDQDPSPLFDHPFETWAQDDGLFRRIRFAEGWANVFRYSYGESDSEPNEIYGIEDEDSKININLASRQILLRLPGVDEDIGDCIMDWRDTDERTRIHGAEATDYQSSGLPYTCANQPFNCLEELLMVKGMDGELLDSLKPFITVYGDSAVNVLTAPDVVLQALGLPENLVQKIDRFRSEGGRFNALSSEEQSRVDLFLQSLGEQEGLRHAERVLLTSYFSLGWLKFDSNIFRIRSEGVVSMAGERIEIHEPSTTVIEVVYERLKDNPNQPIADHPSGHFLYRRED